MKIPTTPIALAAFCLGMIVVPALGASSERQLSSTPQVASQSAASADAEAANPNCLLPGHIREFGRVTMMTPRRPVTLPLADCTARGGEPIEPAAE